MGLTKVSSNFKIMSIYIYLYISKKENNSSSVIFLARLIRVRSDLSVFFFLLYFLGSNVSVFSPAVNFVLMYILFRLLANI